MALSLILAASATQVAAATPTNEEIWALLQQVQQQLTEVQQQNEQLKVENKTLKVKIDQAEQTANSAHETAEAVVEATESAVKSASVSKTTIGGYGELHYNNLEGKKGAKDKDQIDFHRFVLFFGHEFNDRLRLFSEFELEHALVKDTEDGSNKGEVELEQAYLQYDLTDHHRVTAGLFLTPVGIINETHEPPTFYGTERNNVEKNIIPTTWWEGGAMLSGDLPQGFSYDVALTSGLEIDGKKGVYDIRKGRNKVSEAKANDPAYTGRLKWTAIPGIELAASVQYQQDITQGLDPTAGSAFLWETHAVINKGAFGLKALYATWDLNGAGPEKNGYDEQTGWYIEPSYKLNDNIGFFARYSLWDNQAGNSFDSEYTQRDIGLNWWIDPQVVVKLDYQDQSAPTGSKKEQDGVNIGLGYQF